MISEIDKLKHFHIEDSRYSFVTKEWTENKNPICWSGGLFEHKDNVLTVLLIIYLNVENNGKYL